MMSPSFSPSWTGVRLELVAATRLAVPLALSQLGSMLMGTVDVMMLGRVSEVAMAAGALGATVNFGLLIFPMGVLMGLDPIAAQAWGAGDHQGFSRALKQGLMMAFLLSLPITAVMLYARPWLVLFRQAPEILGPTANYLRIVAWSNLPFLLFIAVRQVLQAKSVVRPVVLTMIVTNLVNFVANYLLIFGHGGFPALGVEGSAWATLVARSAMFAALVAMCWPGLREVWRRRVEHWLRPRSYVTFLRVGLPVGLQISFEMWLFGSASLIIGSLGAVELAGHQVAINMTAILFMTPLGIGGAAATRVGNAIGRGDSAGARLSAAVCLGLGAVLMSGAALLLAGAPAFLSRLYTPEATVVAMAASLLPLAALFQVFDAVQAVGVGVLRGAADTRMPAIIAFFGYWAIGLPLGVYLTFNAEMGPRGLWWGFIAGLGSVAVAIFLRILWRLRGEVTALAD